MIRVFAKRKKEQERIHFWREKTIGRLRKQLQSLDYTISEQNCSFVVNRTIIVSGYYICLEALVIPQVGLFQGIQFRPKIYFITSEFSEPPKIYNDRRIFHPNIDAYSLKIIVSQLVNWNPACSYEYILRRLKYVIQEPNIKLIPNNPINKKAGFLYKISRHSFREKMLEYYPACLDYLAGEISQNVMDEQFTDEKNNLINMTHFFLRTSRSYELEEELIEDGQDIDILNKKLKDVCLIEKNNE